MFVSMNICEKYLNYFRKKIVKIADVKTDNDIELFGQSVNEFKSDSTIFRFRPRSGFDQCSLERLEKLFRQTVGNEKEIRMEDFKKIVISKNVSKNHLISR